MNGSTRASVPAVHRGTSFRMARILCAFLSHTPETTPERGGQPLGWLHDPIGPTRDILICATSSDP